MVYGRPFNSHQLQYPIREHKNMLTQKLLENGCSEFWKKFWKKNDSKERIKQQYSRWWELNQLTHPSVIRQYATKTSPCWMVSHQIPLTVASKMPSLGVSAVHPRIPAGMDPKMSGIPLSPAMGRCLPRCETLVLTWRTKIEDFQFYPISQVIFLALQ